MKDKRLITLDNRCLIKDKRLNTFVYEFFKSLLFSLSSFILNPSSLILFSL